MITDNLQAEIAKIISKCKPACKWNKEWYELYIDFDEMKRLKKIVNYKNKDLENDAER